jgi:hypothetical protein
VAAFCFTCNDSPARSYVSIDQTLPGVILG